MHTRPTTSSSSWPFDALLLLTLAVTFLLSSLARAEDGGNPGSYAALLIFCTVGGMIMAGSTNLMGIFIGLEVLSLALYALAGTGFPRRSSAEAALKYVLLGSLASGFLIFGMALLYGAGGSIALSCGACPAADSCSSSALHSSSWASLSNSRLRRSTSGRLIPSEGRRSR